MCGRRDDPAQGPCKLEAQHPGACEFLAGRWTELCGGELHVCRIDLDRFGELQETRLYDDEYESRWTIAHGQGLSDDTVRAIDRIVRAAQERGRILGRYQLQHELRALVDVPGHPERGI
jgi:hypothetical protein